MYFNDNKSWIIHDLTGIHLVLLRCLVLCHCVKFLGAVRWYEYTASTRMPSWWRRWQDHRFICKVSSCDARYKAPKHDVINKGVGVAVKAVCQYTGVTQPVHPLLSTGPLPSLHGRLNTFQIRSQRGDKERNSSPYRRIESSVNWHLLVPADEVKLLNPTGHVMHQQFILQQLYVLPTPYLCVLYLSENKQRLVPLTAYTDRFL